MVQEACGGHMVIWYPPTCLIYEPLFTYAGAGFFSLPSEELLYLGEATCFLPAFSSVL